MATSRSSFNILLYGLGSKRQLLQDLGVYLREHAREEVRGDAIVVNGFAASISLKAILKTYYKYNDIAAPPSLSLIEQCEFVKSMFESNNPGRLFLVIHNIDGPSLRHTSTQIGLSILASAAKIHVVASIDHVNAPLMWDQDMTQRFGWLWHNATTYSPYHYEASASLAAGKIVAAHSR